MAGRLGFEKALDSAATLKGTRKDRAARVRLEEALRGVDSRVGVFAAWPSDEPFQQKAKRPETSVPDNVILLAWVALPEKKKHLLL